MKHETGYYEGIGGRIHYRSWQAASPDWVILLAHGFGDHSGRWERYGETMAEHGGAVLACDHSGHGHSDGARAVIDDFDCVAHDLLGLRDRRSFPGDVPLILAGHSMGGLVVACAALVGDVKPSALVVSGSHLEQWAGTTGVVAQADGAEGLAEAGRGNPLFDPDVTLAPDALSRDTAIVGQFSDDPLTYAGTMPIETLRAWIKAVDGLERARQGAYDFPVLYLHGGADPITSHRGSLHRIVELANDDLEVRIFPDTRHSIFNELNRDEVYAALLQFIGRVLGHRASPGELPGDGMPHGEGAAAARSVGPESTSR